MRVSPDAEIDLVGLVSPICLLELKRALRSLGPGQILEVLIQDYQVAEKIIQIVERSPDRLLDLREADSAYRIRIQKG